MICARNEGSDAGGKISLLNAAIIPTSPTAAAEGEEGGRDGDDLPSRKRTIPRVRKCLALSHSIRIRQRARTRA